jgi:glycolate oxidase FAD binding subunit
VDLTGDVAGATEAIAASVANADVVLPVGARTQWETGNPPSAGVEVRARTGVTHYEPDDLTVTVGAGTSFAALDAILSEHGQECPLDPRDPAATVGGVIACGLSGIRRLRHGPLRDHVLEVRFVTADGRLVKGGGPTVKNVTGYDLPRLFVGSFGTLGVLVQLILRCRPRPAHSRWVRTDAPIDRFRPAAMLWDGRQVFTLLEGAETDVIAQSADLAPCAPPALPTGDHRGRISAPPGALEAIGDALETVAGARWCAEIGVGTVHVAGDDAGVLVGARAVANHHGGWLLREAGGDGLDGFGRALPNGELMRRVKDAFDPTGKLSPGRLPL